MEKFFNLSTEEAKQLLKNLQNDVKNIQKTGMRKVLACEHTTLEKCFEFCKLQNEDFYKRFNEEKERAWLFLNDKEEATKAGWYDKKCEESKLLAWANKAYPNFSEQLWANEFEQRMLIDYLKS